MAGAAGQAPTGRASFVVGKSLQRSAGIRAGVQSWASGRKGGRKPGGMTPTTTCGVPSSVSERPMAPGSAPKWSLQNA